jgi:SpoOM protein
VTEATTQRSGGAWESDSGGVRWHLELDRMPLLPGRLVGGRIRLVARDPVQARAVVVALIAEEHWRHEVTERDANGNTTTRIVNEKHEHVREPVMVHGALALAAGETWDATFELPVPPMGPASLDAEEAGLDWAIEAKLDIDNSLDSSLEAPVVVAQPLALLRAGAVHVGQFALYESADVAAEGTTGSIAFDTMPLVTDGPFHGRLRLELAQPAKLQEIRAELRVEVRATVSGGRHETITAWAAQLAAEGSFAGQLGVDIAGALSSRPLPTSELPHGSAQATFHVILARGWAPDTHLVRDVTIATTSEL